MPCEDSEVCTDQGAEQVVYDDCGGMEIGDLCSPFCHCQCCSISYISFQIDHCNVLDPDIAQGKFLVTDSQEQEVLHSLHHPPKV